MSRRTHAVCGFLPPHILRSIAENSDDPSQREQAYAALELSAQLRGARIAAGKIAGAEMLLGPAIYDARHRTALPGVPLHANDTDAAASEAHAAAGITAEFYAKVYQRNAIDGRGLPLHASVHFGVRYPNALWNGRQLIYGDGDGKLFNRFTRLLDVAAHELTHCVTQHTAGLVYQEQSGALSEHFSDVFGILVKQYALKQTAAKSDWLIGAGIFTSAVHAAAVRSMKAPGTAYDDEVAGKDPQPAHMKDYRKMTADNGGVHVNSGIPNRAFYLAATALGGKAWTVAGRIWYDALTTLLKPSANFRDCARATAAAASARYGAHSEPHRAVVHAWKEVGIDITAVVTSGPKLPIADFVPPAAAAELPPFEHRPRRRAAK